MAEHGEFGEQHYAELMRIQECQCGAWKRKKMPFCHVCWHALPDPLRRVLISGTQTWAEVGPGYDAALHFLKK